MTNSTPNPHYGIGRRYDRPVTKQTLEDVESSFIDNEFGVPWIKWGASDGSDGVALGPTYDNNTLNQRIESGYYNQLDTPGMLLARVRRKLATCTNPNDIALGQYIIKVLAIEGMDGLTEKQYDWIPDPDTYEECRAAIEQKIAPMLDALEIPQELQREVDDDFAALMDPGGIEKNPTGRQGLLVRLKGWLFGEAQHEAIEVSKDVDRGL